MTQSILNLFSTVTNLIQFVIQDDRPWSISKWYPEMNAAERGGNEVLVFYIIYVIWLVYMLPSRDSIG